MKVVMINKVQIKHPKLNEEQDQFIKNYVDEHMKMFKELERENGVKLIRKEVWKNLPIELFSFIRAIHKEFKKRNMDLIAQPYYLDAKKLCIRIAKNEIDGGIVDANGHLVRTSDYLRGK